MFKYYVTSTMNKENECGNHDFLGDVLLAL